MALDRALDAQGLLDEALHQGGVGPEELQLVRVADEQPHGVGQPAGDGLEAPGDELVHEVLQLVHRERFLAVDLLVHVHEGRHDVVARIGPAGLEHHGEVVLGLDLQVDAGIELGLGEQARRRRQHGVTPALEGADLAPIETELLGDDRAGQRVGELLEELALAAGRERVDELVDDVLDVGDQLPHRRGLNTRFTIRRYRVCSGGSVRWRVDRWLQPRSAKARRRRSESSACRPLEMFDWEEMMRDKEASSGGCLTPCIP